MALWLSAFRALGLSCSLGLWLYGSFAFCLALWLSGSRKGLFGAVFGVFGLFEYSQRVIGVNVHLSHLRLRDETKAEADQK